MKPKCSKLRRNRYLYHPSANPQARPPKTLGTATDPFYDRGAANAPGPRRVAEPARREKARAATDLRGLGGAGPPEPTAPHYRPRQRPTRTASSRRDTRPPAGTPHLTAAAPQPPPSRRSGQASRSRPAPFECAGPAGIGSRRHRVRTGGPGAGSRPRARSAAAVPGPLPAPRPVARSQRSPERGVCCSAGLPRRQPAAGEPAVPTSPRTEPARYRELLGRRRRAVLLSPPTRENGSVQKREDCRMKKIIKYRFTQSPQDIKTGLLLRMCAFYNRLGTYCTTELI